MIVNKCIMPKVTFLLLYNGCIFVIGKNVEIIHEERKRKKLKNHASLPS